MLTTLAISNYRSLLEVIIPLGRLNLVTGPNGSGKSNLYRALRLLAETAQSGVVSALAREGGLPSTFWAGPETLSAAMRLGDAPVHGGPRKGPKRLRMGFAAEDFSYSIALGLPAPPAAQGMRCATCSYDPQRNCPYCSTAFGLDPEIKHEAIWAGEIQRPAAMLIERGLATIKVRTGKKWEMVSESCIPFDTVFGQISDPSAAPVVFRLRDTIRRWRFYDAFRTDRDAPARQPQVATRTPALAHDGADLAAALQTIREVGDDRGLDAAVADAFPGAAVDTQIDHEGLIALRFYQRGLLRPLTAAELSDGTLRYLLWIAALMTPRPPALMVLNEPETSLHPDLLPALARLIQHAARQSQVWVVSHSVPLIAALEATPECNAIRLTKDTGDTQVVGQRLLDVPAWHWPD